MIVLTLLTATLAMALFGLATSAHYERRLGRPLRSIPGRKMRIVAWMLVATTFILAGASEGWVFGPILGIGTLMLGAGGTFLGLNLLPAPAPIRKGGGSGS